jgi:hypothetical protein
MAEEIMATGKHVAGKEKTAISETAWPLLEAEAARLRSPPTDSGTALVNGALCDSLLRRSHPVVLRVRWISSLMV